MNRATRPLAAALVFAAAVGLTVSPSARAQPRFPEPPQQPPPMITGGGTDLFRALLDKEGVQPVSARDYQNGNVRPGDDLIVVVLGSPNGFVGRAGQDPLSLARLTLQLNGAVLIATDSPCQLHHFSHVPNFNEPIATVSGNIVQADWNDCHRGNPECPYVVPVSPDERLAPGAKPGPVWGLFRGLTKLATNQSSYLEMPGDFRGEFQYPLARLPKSSVQWNGQRFKAPPLFAVGGDGPEQRGFRPLSGYAFLALADSSVYINQMLLEMAPGLETDNLKFAERTVEYLQGPQKHRKRCLFFENGKVVDKFDGLRQAMAKPKPKIPPEAMPNIPKLIERNQDKLIDMANGMADQIQKKDALHNVVLGEPGSPREQQRFASALDVAAVIAAISVTLLLLRRTLRARQPVDVPPPPNTGAGAASTGPPGVFDRRQKELVRRNNLFEPVRNLMREFFDSVGAPPNPGPRIPTLEISDAVRKPESLRQAIRDMWRIAYGPPQPISAQRWFELEPYFDRLRQAHADGKWRFVTDEA